MIKINLHARAKDEPQKWIFTLTLFLVALLVGTLSQAREAFIHDGEIAGPDEYPAVFSIKMSSRGIGADGYEGSCTGFLVHPKLLLTAAHCLQGHSDIDALTNAVDANSGRDARKFKSAEVGSNPDFVLPSRDRTDEQNAASAANDIGYIVLKEEVTDITPALVYPESNIPSMNKLFNLDAVLVGYGAEKWVPGGNFENAKVGVKHVGKKPVSGVNVGYITLDGEKGASLPGDSGGPIFAVVDGVTKVIALNHALSPTTKTVPKMKNGQVKTDGKGKPETKQIRLSDFGTTVGTMMTKKNLCWVVAQSGIAIPGVDCTPEAKAAPAATPPGGAK